MFLTWRRRAVIPKGMGSINKRLFGRNGGGSKKEKENENYGLTFQGRRGILSKLSRDTGRQEVRK